MNSRTKRMNEDSEQLRELIQRAASEDPAAAGQLFDLHRERLRRMIRVRLDQRLQGRLDPSDVLQEAFLEFARSLPAYAKKPEGPFYVWLRCITGRKLHALHRQHLGTHKRDAAREDAKGRVSQFVARVRLQSWIRGSKSFEQFYNDARSLAARMRCAIRNELDSD